MLPSEPYLYQSVVSCWKVLKLTKSSQSQATTITSQCHMSNEYTGFYFTNHEIKQCCHLLVHVNKCKIFKRLIETLFLRLFEPDQSEIKEIFQEIVNIHKKRRGNF